MIKNIIFDLGNVIISFNQNKIISNFTQKQEEIKYICDEIFHAPEWELMDLGNITNDEAIEIINKRNGYKYQKLTENFLHEWYKKRLFNNDVIKIAKDLSKKGYKLFVLSNMANSTYEYLRKYEFFSLCSGIIISAYEHVLKPDKKIYRLLLERYNLNAEECFFIDDREENIIAGEKIGIKGHVLNREKYGTRKLIEDFNKYSIEI